MSKETAISWTDHTFNPWWGCTKISSGCVNCYAEAFDKRLGGDHFGHGKPRKTFGDKHWAEPLKWNAQAAKDGVRRRVFCGSMCDVFDAVDNLKEFARLFRLIGKTPNLDWLLLTKRPEVWTLSDVDYADMDNVWLGVTVESAEYKFRIDHLRKMKSPVKFLSCEPLLGPLGPLDLTGIDWVIVGGESGPNARPMHPSWALEIQGQCKEQGVAFFFKQWGGKGKDKGGCLVEDKEIKEFPR